MTLKLAYGKLETHNLSGSNTLGPGFRGWEEREKGEARWEGR